MKLKLIYSFSIIALLILISSCGKSTENKIVGTWNKISVGPINSTTNVWTFTADHHLYVTRTTVIDSTSSSIQQDTATWSISIHTFSKNTLKINQVNAAKNIAFPHVEGEFEIRELNDILVLQRFKLGNGETDGAYAWHEFEKTK